MRSRTSRTWPHRSRSSAATIGPARSRASTSRTFPVNGQISMRGISRIDLDTAAAHEFRESLLRDLAQPSALLPYRPSGFLSAIAFARRDSCLNLGLFGAHQAVFEHKPWVEMMVADLGIPHLAWTYVADEEMTTARQMLSDGPIMLRTSRSSGGAGIVRVDDPDEVVGHWPRQSDAFASVSRFLEGAVPVNIAATVWHDGVTLCHPSVQLVGIPECTTRPFGYCGNDFGLARDLDDATWVSVEASVIAIGRWLRGYGYLGTFGVDFIVHDGVPLFTEVNPRFQGSTHASSQISREAGESCVVLITLPLGSGMRCHLVGRYASSSRTCRSLPTSWFTGISDRE